MKGKLTRAITNYLHKARTHPTIMIITSNNNL